MKNRAFLYLISLFIFVGCASTPPPNQWQFDSSSNFEEYQNAYLKGDFELAKDFLEKAIKDAKSSSNLDTLASIELSRVALRVALFKNPRWREYRKLEPLTKDNSLKAYAKLLGKNIASDEVKNLPKQYRAFAIAMVSNDFDRANSIISKMKSPTSQMVAGALIKKNLSYQNIEKIVDKISFYGYRVAVIEWLKFQISKTEDREKRKILKKKLKILES